MSYLLCKITATPGALAGCPNVTPGLHATDVWIGNKDDVTLAAAVDGTITSLPTMAAATNLYKLAVLEDDGDMKNTLSQGGFGSSWTHEASMRIININADTRKFLSEASNGRFVIFRRTKSGEILVGGIDDGMKLIEGTEAGVAEDTFGAQLVFQAEKNSEVMPGLLDTDLATTVAGLDALV